MAALTGDVVCTQENTQCVNTYGSFDCVCVPGYELMNRNCQRKENCITTNVFSYIFNQALLEK